MPGATSAISIEQSLRTLAAVDLARAPRHRDSTGAIRGGLRAVEHAAHLPQERVGVTGFCDRVIDPDN